MAILYLIVGNRITREIDTENVAFVAFPALRGSENMNLINQTHILNLMNRFNRTTSQIIVDLGLIDEREMEP